MYGIEDFTAVINPPHATILAVGAGEERAIAQGGKIVAATIMSCTLSCDHRAVDGALGAQLIGAFKGSSKTPSRCWFKAKPPNSFCLLPQREREEIKRVNMAEAFDVAVIGAGPGGYVAAIRAAQLGLKTAVVEREHLGGICLNWGCIPTKALLRTAEIYPLQHADEYGLAAKDVGFDLPRSSSGRGKWRSKLSSGVAFLLKKNKVTVI